MSGTKAERMFCLMGDDNLASAGHRAQPQGFSAVAPERLYQRPQSDDKVSFRLYCHEIAWWRREKGLQLPTVSCPFRGQLIAGVRSYLREETWWPCQDFLALVDVPFALLGRGTVLYSQHSDYHFINFSIAHGIQYGFTFRLVTPNCTPPLSLDILEEYMVSKTGLSL
jgi:hypothetical protein